ncbi:MAG: putative Ig domain-containing protein, partial [Planctomycetes bacterium]|nr:putative Ig domain-containing protein [Planctomycetota bacterium]
MFDLTLNQQTSITGVDVNSTAAAATSQPISIHYITNSAVAGNETTPGNWTLHETGTYLAAGVGNASNFTFSTPLVLPAGTHAIYVEFEAAYTNGAFTYSDSFMSIQTGVGLCGSFSGTNNPRSWNGTIYYSLGDPSIFLSRSSVAIGVTDDLGDNPPGTPIVLTYDILNPAVNSNTLTITTPVTNPANLANCTANVTSQPAGSLAPGAATTLEITVTPTGAGPFSCDVSFANNTTFQNPASFTIQGIGRVSSVEVSAVQLASMGIPNYRGGATNILAHGLVFESFINPQDVNSVVITKTGSLPDADIAAVNLWQDNGNGVFEPATDTQLGGSQTFSGGTATFTAAPLVSIPLGAANAATFWVSIDLVASPTAAATFGTSLNASGDVSLASTDPALAIAGQSFPFAGSTFSVASALTPTLPYTVNFDSALGGNVVAQTVGDFPSWDTATITTITTTVEARIQLGNGFAGGNVPFSAPNMVGIDFPNGQATGAIDFLLDLSAFNATSNSLILEFQWLDNGDETQNDDGVFVSVDGGTTWINLVDLAPASFANNTWSTVVADVSAALTAATLNYTNQFVIRFQAGDNVPFGSDGQCFDDVVLREIVPSLEVGDLATQVTPAFPNVAGGNTQLLAGAFDLTALVNNQDINSIVLTKTGSLPDSDIASVDLWLDDGNGVFNPAADTAIGGSTTFSSGTATFAGMPLVSVTAALSPTARLFVSLDLVASPTTGATFGVSINAASDVTLVGSDPVNASTGSSFPMTGPSFTVATPVTSLPFSENFDATLATNLVVQTVGDFPLWDGATITTVTRTAPARLRVGNGFAGPYTPNTAPNMLGFDFPNGTATGAVDFLFDLSAFNVASDNIAVSFNWLDSGDETSNDDGVFVSVDGGATWINLVDLDPASVVNGVWIPFVVDITAALTAATLNFTNQVVVRFQAGDTAAFTADGQCFDDIVVGFSQEIDVQRPTGTSLGSGTGPATDNLGNVSTSGQTFVYTIANLGDLPLDLNGTPIVDAPTAQQSNCGVTVNTTTTANPVAGGTTTTFSVTVTPATPTNFSFDIVIVSTDADEPTYTINVSGAGVVNAAAQADFSTGSSFAGSTNGPFNLAVDPGTALVNASIDLTDAESDTITVASITATTTAPTGITAPSIPTPGQPLTLTWTGTADASNAPAVYTWQVTFSDAVNGSSIVVDVNITINDVAPTSTILNASGGDGSSGTPYTGSFVVGDTGATSIDLATITDGNTGQTVALNGTPSQTSGPTGGTGFQFTLSAGILTVAPAGALVAADAGVQVFDVVVTDGGANTTTTFSVSLTVSGVSTVMAFTNTSPLAGGTVGTVYGPVTMAVTGATGTVAFSIVNNTNLPAGLTLNGSTGEITGTPT